MLKIQPFSVSPIQIPTPFSSFGVTPKQSVCLAGCENSEISERVLETLSNLCSKLILDHWDSQDKTLRGKLACLHNVQQEQILLTSGALNAINYVFEVFVQSQTKVGLLAPDFSGFRFYAERSRACIFRFVKAKFPFTLTLDEIIDFVHRDRLEFLIFSNPNAAIGTRLSSDEIHILISSCPDTLIVIDEADALDTESVAFLTNQYENLIVLRSFSKFYGLSGLRIGYLVTPMVFANPLKDMVNPIELTSLSILAATVVLDDLQYQLQTQKRVIENHAILEDACMGTRYQVVPGSTCFACYLWAYEGEDPFTSLKHNGIDIACGKIFGVEFGGRVNISDTMGIRAIADFLKK